MYGTNLDNNICIKYNATMGQTLVKNYMHIIFSTKYRQPLIGTVIENELYSYIAGICKNMDCQPIKIGGHLDHVHILCMLSKKIALIKWLEDVKSDSSKWIKTRGNFIQTFIGKMDMEHFLLRPIKWME